MLCTDAGLPGVGSGPVMRSFVETHPNRPVLVCSGHVEDELVRQGLELGRWTFLQKSVEPNILLKEIRRLVNAESPADFGEVQHPVQ